MNRKLFRERPEFESMESMILLSTVSITGRSGDAEVAEFEAKRHSILLSGTVNGTYSLRGAPGPVKTVSAKGSIAPLGKVTLKGSIQLTGPNLGGSVKISTKQGKVFAKLSASGIGGPLYYQITRGTGKLAGVSGTGEAVITIVPRKGGRPDHGTLTITFTTAATAIVPTVTSETPASNATAVAITSSVTATFNEAVQSGTIGFTLASSSGIGVAGILVYSSSNNTLILTPSAALAYSTTYTATISAAQSSSGVPMTAPVTWSFTTVALRVPSVRSETPAPSTTGVAVSSPVSAVFNEAVQSGTITFTLTSSTGSAVAATVAYNSSTNTATLTPSAALAYATTYTANVSGAKDTAGDPMSGPVTWSFTTDAEQPAVTAESPATGDTGVAVSSPVSAVFNEDVQSGTITFTLTSSSGPAVVGSLSYDSATNTATFTPNAALASNTAYTASITGAKDTAGDPISGPFTWTFTTEPATGTTYWVSNSGSDSNSGSEASPWLTLQAAVNKLAAGDTLNVEAGTYAGFSVGYSTSVLAGTSTSPITVQAAPGTTAGTVIIDSQNPDRACAIDLEPGCNYWTISGLSVINSNSQFAAEGIYITSNHVNILDCTINGDGNDMNYCILTSGSYLTIQGNDCSKATGTGLYGHGIYCSNSSKGVNITNIYIIGNTIYSCSEHGLQVNGDSTGIEAATNCIIEGNTIYNITAGSGMNLDAVQNSTISNNLIYNYTVYGIVLFSDSTQYATNNIIVNNSIYHGTTGNYVALAIGADTDADTDNTVLNNILLGASSYGNDGTAIAVNSESIPGLVSNYNVVGTTNAEATFSVNAGISSESWASWKSGTGQDENSVVGSLSALFVNYSSNNYQEAAGSPSIGAGTSTDAPRTDILGNPRPSSYGFDIGCFEYESSTSDSIMASKTPASGATKVAVSLPVTASGMLQLSPLPTTIQTITVTSNGPVWGSGGGSSNNVVIGFLPAATAVATSNGGTTSNQTGIKSSRTLSGGAGISMMAPQTMSLGTSQGVTQGRTLVCDKAVQAIVPESLLDMLSQDLILSNHKKSPGGSGLTHQISRGYGPVH